MEERLWTFSLWRLPWLTCVLFDRVYKSDSAANGNGSDSAYLMYNQPPHVVFISGFLLISKNSMVLLLRTHLSVIDSQLKQMMVKSVTRLLHSLNHKRKDLPH